MSTIRRVGLNPLIFLLHFKDSNGVSVLQQACKSSCSQITDMVQPEEGDSEEEEKKKLSIEVRPVYTHITN